MSHIQIAKQVNKDLREIEATSERIGTGKNINKIRDFSFITDQSVRAGGMNEAPSPMEYILGAFNGCILVVIERIAKEMDFSFTQLNAKSIGTVDRRGAQGVEGISPHFKHVTNTILFETSETEARIEALKAQVSKRCPALNLFSDAKIEIILNWIHQEAEEDI